MATYYVRSDSAGGGDGTDPDAVSGPNAAYSSFNEARDDGVVIAGNTILAKRGSVWSSTGYTHQASGTGAPGSGNEIIFGAYGTGDKPQINGNPAASGRAMVFSVHINIHVQDLDLRGDANGTDGEAVYTFSSSGSGNQNIHFTDCDFDVKNAVSGNHTVYMNKAGSFNHGFNLKFNGCNFTTQKVTPSAGQNKLLTFSQLGFTSGTFYTFYDIEVKNCTFTGSGAGVWMWPNGWSTEMETYYYTQEARPYGIVIEDNTFYDLTGLCMSWSMGTRGVEGYENTFNNNTCTNIGSVSVNDQNALQTHWNEDLLIEGNIIDGMTTSQPDGCGIILDQINNQAELYPCDNVTVRYNYIANCNSSGSGKGISGFHAKNCKIYSNVIYSCDDGYRGNSSFSTGNLIYNNVFDSCINGINLRDFFDQIGHATVVVQNNVFVNNTNGLNTDQYTSSAAHDETYNLYYNNTTDFSGGTIDGTSVESDPLLDSDYKPTAASPCIEAGVYIAGIKDKNGRPFRVPPTIGAYEMSSGFPAQTRTTATTRSVSSTRSAASARTTRD